MYIFLLSLVLLVVYLKRLWLTQGCKDLFLYFQRIIALALINRSVTHVGLIFGWCEDGVQPHSFACGSLVLRTSFVEKTVLSH